MLRLCPSSSSSRKACSSIQELVEFENQWRWPTEIQIESQLISSEVSEAFLTLWFMMHSDIVSNDVHPRERSETSAACLGMPPTVAPQTHKMLRDTKSLTTALRRPQSIESHVIHSSPWGCPTAVIGFRAESLMIYGYDFDPYPYHPTYKYIYIYNYIYNIYPMYFCCIADSSVCWRFPTGQWPSGWWADQ